jgi:hypothetical protein
MSKPDFLPTSICSDSDSDSESEFELEIQPDQFMTLEERFDQHKLHTLLQNKNKFKKRMRASCFEGDHNPFAVMEKYLKQSRKGRISVKYKQNNGIGRYFAVGGLSMQSLPREVRHTIQKGYVDVDVVNAHPVILSHICKSRGISTKYLDRYIKGRDELLEELKVEREAGKTAVLSFMNGGSSAYEKLPHKPSWIKKMKKEMDKIHNSFASDDAFAVHRQKREKQGVDRNHKGSYMNVLLCDFENKILQAMYEYFGRPSNAVLCFDGIMVAGEPDLNCCEKHIEKELGIKIKLKVKAMEDGFDLNSVQQYEDHEWFYHNFRDFTRQAPSVDLEELKDWMKETCIVAINRGRSMLFTKNLEVDGSISYEPQDSLNISEFKWVGEGKKKYSTNTIFQTVRWQNSYDYFNFVPYLTEEQRMRISPRIFNTFSGYRWEYQVREYEKELGIPIPPASIRPWIDHVKNTLCGGGELGHRVLQWYAHIFQCPTVKPWALIFQSEEGIGKGLWQTFFEQVLTKALCSTFGSWDQITGSFNGKMAGKLLFTLNEATNYPTNTQKELMKAMIKDTELCVNKKFVNQYDIDNYARIQITTNNERPVVIDHDDRRYCCIKADNSNRGNSAYFAPLIESRGDEKVQHEMFDFLTNYPLDGFDSEKPPMTQWKRELIGENLDSTMEFVRSIFAEDDHAALQGVFEWDEDQEVLKIKAGDLFDSYQVFCSNAGEHTRISDRGFHSKLKKNGLVKQRIRLEGVRQYAYTLTKTDLRERFKTLLCNPDFEF